MDYSQIRTRARENLRNSWGISIAVAVIAVLLGGGINCDSFLPDADMPIPIPVLTELSYLLNQGISVGNVTFSISGGILGLIAFLAGGAVELGYAQFLLNQHDGKDFQLSDLFSQFHRFGQGFAQYFLKSMYTILWSLLLIIPGIMAGLSYSMTAFIMIDHPELSANEAITRSKEMMDGHKWELFVMNLSFFGWTFLSILCANLGFVILNPYTASAAAVFYRKLQGERQRQLPYEEI